MSATLEYKEQVKKTSFKHERKEFKRFYPVLADRSINRQAVCGVKGSTYVGIAGSNSIR
jgi:hypothetical protein